MNPGKNCIKHVVKSLDLPLFQHSSHGAWYYASNQPLTLVATCPKHTETLLLPLGVGALSIPPGCRVNSKEVLVPAMQSISNKPEHINFTHLIPFNISLSPMEHELLSKFNTNFYQDLLSLNSAPIPLLSLQNDLKNLHTIGRSHAFVTVTSSYAATICTALLILFSCLLLAAWYMKRRLLMNMHNHPQRIPQQADTPM